MLKFCKFQFKIAEILKVSQECFQKLITLKSGVFMRLK